MDYRFESIQLINLYYSFTSNSLLKTWLKEIITCNLFYYSKVKHTPSSFQVSSRLENGDLQSYSLIILNSFFFSGGRHAIWMLSMPGANHLLLVTRIISHNPSNLESCSLLLALSEIVFSFARLILL